MGRDRSPNTPGTRLMGQERFERIAQIFENAREQPAAVQAAILDRECAEDEELRKIVAALLERYEPDMDLRIDD